MFLWQISLWCTDFYNLLFAVWPVYYAGRFTKLVPGAHSVVFLSWSCMCTGLLMAGIKAIANIMDLTLSPVNVWVGFCSVVMLEFLIKPKCSEVLSCKNYSSIEYCPDAWNLIRPVCILVHQSSWLSFWRKRLPAAEGFLVQRSSCPSSNWRVWGLSWWGRLLWWLLFQVWSKDWESAMGWQRVRPCWSSRGPPNWSATSCSCSCRGTWGRILFCSRIECG